MEHEPVEGHADAAPPGVAAVKRDELEHALVEEPPDAAPPEVVAVERDELEPVLVDFQASRGGKAAAVAALGGRAVRDAPCAGAMPLPEK